MLRFCERGISAEIQKFAKKRQVLVYAKCSNIFYTVLANCCFFSVYNSFFYISIFQYSAFKRKFPQTNSIPFYAKFRKICFSNMRKFSRFTIPKLAQFPQKKIRKILFHNLRKLIFSAQKNSFFFQTYKIQQFDLLIYSA